MFDKILIANRGEIACRIVRTCRRLGIRTVAVYSDADRDAPHAAWADEAVRLGPAPAHGSYLNIEAVLDAARRTSAQAIHPGYGFLSENADFAEACARAGVIFIGPPAAAIRAMGSKSAAKAIMDKAGVPVVPGYHGDNQDEALLGREAERIGYPVLIKAVSGGGGKGMRRVDSAQEFGEALLAARREAAAAFGDEQVLVEKFIEQPRHIEIQIFADEHGNVVHLFERDCSVQRRHQKILEEAPAPGMKAERRTRMGQAAVQAARAIDYCGAGTVEFIATPDGAFYFMEMNTRLQVEHPVTEMVTGQDLVEWQLHVAAGAALPHTQATLKLDGHAFEARVYAEDPARGFLPATGTIHHLRVPEAPWLRIDSGVREGDAVGLHYDPMIAKLVAWGPDRATALRRLQHLLGAYQLVGPATNLSFLARVAAHPDFAAGRITTGFIEQHRDALFEPAPPAPLRALAAACLQEIAALARTAAERARHDPDPYSPWHTIDGWEPNANPGLILRWRDGEREIAVTAVREDAGWCLHLPDGSRLNTRAEALGARALRVSLDGMDYTATVATVGDQRTVFTNGGSWRLTLVNPIVFDTAHTLTEGSLTAPMPGTIIDIRARVGEPVSSGETLMILEAMKMEYTVTAPGDGIVDAVLVARGQQVADGAELLTLRPGVEDRPIEPDQTQ